MIMKNIHYTGALLVIAALIGACSSLPKTTSLLDQTRSEYVAAQNNPRVAHYAPLEMQQAGVALEQANAAARRDDSTEQIDKLAYLAKQKIALAQEAGKQKAAEADVQSAGRERDRVRLDQRTAEADQARSSAEQSRQDALLAEEDAAKAERQTMLARGDAADAQRRTVAAQARTATLEAQLADLAAKQTERGLVITLGDVLFGTDQTKLTPEGVDTLKKLAAVLEQYPQRTVLIEGFTDSTGSAAHNQELSERRASAVRSALQEMGVTRDRVAMRGYGEKYPVAANDTKQNRQLNRRVEIVISNGDGQIPQR
jgi:outer membrane protein OmpA-like peptidoglycan-associated protein